MKLINYSKNFWQIFFQIASTFKINWIELAIFIFVKDVNLWISGTYMSNQAWKKIQQQTIIANMTPIF